MDALDVHHVPHRTAVQEVEADLVDVPLPEGLVRKLHRQGVELSVGDETATHRGVGIGIDDVPCAEEEVGGVVALAVGGRKHIYDLNGLAGVRRKGTVINNGDVGIVPVDRECRTQLGGLEDHRRIVGGHHVGGVPLDGQIQAGGQGIGGSGTAALLLVGVGVFVGYGCVVGNAVVLPVLVQGGIGGEVLVVGEGGADIRKTARGDEVAVLQGLKGLDQNEVDGSHVVGGAVGGFLGVVEGMASRQERIHVGDEQTDAEILLGVGPGAPGLGVARAKTEGAVTVPGGIAPEIQIVAVGHSIARPGLGAVVEGEGAEVGDGVEGGYLLGGHAVGPAREIGEAVVHLYAVAVEGVGVLHVGGGDLPVLGPVHGLGLDVDRAVSHHNVHDAAVVALDVTALDGVVAPLGAVVEAGRVLAVLHDTVVGLLDQAPRVGLVDQILQTPDVALLVLQVVDTAAPGETDAQLVTEVLDVVGVRPFAVDRVVPGMHDTEREIGGLAVAGLQGHGFNARALAAVQVLPDDAGEGVGTRLQVEVVGGLLAACGVGDLTVQGLGGGVAQGEAVEGLGGACGIEDQGQILGKGQGAV